MSNGRSELFVFITVAFVTAGGLFGLQQVYASYIDMSYHAALTQQGPNEAVIALRETEAQKLAGGKLPIERAKAELAEKPRNAIGAIAPVQSDDLSAVSGWIRLHSFKAAVAHAIRTPRAPVVAPAPVPAAEPAPVPVAPVPEPVKKPARPARKVAAPAAAAPAAP